MLKPESSESFFMIILEPQVGSVPNRLSMVFMRMLFTGVGSVSGRPVLQEKKQQIIMIARVQWIGCANIYLESPWVHPERSGPSLALGKFHPETVPC